MLQSEPPTDQHAESEHKHGVRIVGLKDLA